MTQTSSMLESAQTRSPVPETIPQDGKCYFWDESTASWVNPEDLKEQQNV